MDSPLDNSSRKMTILNQPHCNVRTLHLGETSSFTNLEGKRVTDVDGRLAQDLQSSS